MPVPVSSFGEKRKAKRFCISCPVTITLGTRGRTAWSGHLQDIGTNGACFRLNRQLAVGQVLVLLVHFQDPDKGVTTVRFLGTVTRAQASPPFEIAVRFRRRGRFLRDLAESVQGSQHATAPKTDSAPWIN